jgi:hypothetical protein
MIVHVDGVGQVPAIMLQFFSAARRLIHCARDCSLVDDDAEGCGAVGEGWGGSGSCKRVLRFENGEVRGAPWRRQVMPRAFRASTSIETWEKVSQ